MRELNSASEVIDELGGTTPAAKLAGVTLQAVSNWRATGRLPADTFLVITQILSERGATAPISLWGMKEPERAA